MVLGGPGDELEGGWVDFHVAPDEFNSLWANNICTVQHYQESKVALEVYEDNLALFPISTRWQGCQRILSEAQGESALGFNKSVTLRRFFQLIKKVKLE